MEYKLINIGYKIGDLVKCVNNGVTLTRNKIYKVKDIKNTDTYIIDDYGNEEGYCHDRFELVPQFTKSYLMQEPERWEVKFSDNTIMNFKEVNDLCIKEDLTGTSTINNDIIAIYEVSKEPVWTREVEKHTREMTVEEISKELGYDVKIVKG